MPANELDEFNENSVGEIELIAIYRGADGSPPIEVTVYDAGFHEE